MQKNFFWFVFFLVLQLIVVLRNWLTGYWVFYWFCDFAPLLLAASFFWKKLTMTQGIIEIGLLGQVAFIISLFSAMVFGAPLFGFDIDPHMHLLNLLATLFIHLSTMIAWYAIFDEKIYAHSLLSAMGMLYGIYAVVLWCTPVDVGVGGNFNYIYFAAPFTQLPSYTMLWPLIAFAVAVLPAFAIMHGVRDTLHAVGRRLHIDDGVLPPKT